MKLLAVAFLGLVVITATAPEVGASTAPAQGASWNGVWVGKTSTNRDVNFVVIDGQVVSAFVQWDYSAGCAGADLRREFSTPLPIGSGGGFTGQMSGRQGSAYWDVFIYGAISGSTISGSLSYGFSESDPFLGCHNNGFGVFFDRTFTATFHTPAMTFSQHPTTVSVENGQPAVFSVGVSSATATVVQWQVSVDEGTTFTNLADGSTYSGVTSGTLTIASAALNMHGARYRARVANAWMTMFSSAAQLLVTPDAETLARPFGQVDSPAQGATGVQGAIGVTGWVLDDVGVSSVRIYRSCLSGIDSPASCQGVLGQSLVFIGDAAFLAGARPDVEAAYPTHPNNARAGWGYLLLTSMLPNRTTNQTHGGVGAMTLYVVATDGDGRQTFLGRSSVLTSADVATPTAVTLANDTIAKPFGAIDTPAQGATVSGVLANFGWALTPDSNTSAGSGDILIPTTGATMTVFIDSVPVAQVTYNQCRGSVGNPVPGGTYCNDDVANIFGNAAPQAVLTTRTSNPTLYRNLDAARAAIGSYAFNTATLSNGLHTIAWSVTDSANRTEGIGSRFFNVLNTSGDTTSGIVSGASSSEPRTSGIVSGASSSETRTSGIVSGASISETMPDVLDAALRGRPAEIRGPAWALGFLPEGPAGVWARTGFDLMRSWEDLPVGADGRRVVEIASGSRVELWLGAAAGRGFLVANGTLRDLPPGATLRGAQFAWAPPIGYVGEYLLSFVRGGDRVDVTVIVR